MENPKSRRSAIRWYKHYMSIRMGDLIAEYTSSLGRSDVAMPPSLDKAMEERAPKAKAEFDAEVENNDA